MRSISNLHVKRLLLCRFCLIWGLSIWPPCFAKEYQYLEQVIGEPIFSIELLEGGLSGAHVYKVRFANKTYVLKSFSSKKKFFHYYREMYYSQLAGMYDIAPKVYYADIEKNVLLIDYVAKQPLSQNVELRLDLLSKILKNIHNLPNQENNLIDKPTPYKKIKYFRKHIELDKLPKFVKNKIDVALSLELKYKDINKAICHNDLNPGNILYLGNRNAKVIDWSAAGLFDPFYDVGTVLNWYFYEPNTRYAFLERYLGYSPTMEEITRAEDMQLINRVLLGAAFLKISQINVWDQKVLDNLPTFEDFLEGLGSSKERLQTKEELFRAGMILLKYAKPEAIDKKH